MASTFEKRMGMADEPREDDPAPVESEDDLPEPEVGDENAERPRPAETEEEHEAREAENDDQEG